MISAKVNDRSAVEVSVQEENKILKSLINANFVIKHCRHELQEQSLKIRTIFEDSLMKC